MTESTDDGETSSLMLNELKGATEFEIKVRAVDHGGNEGPFTDSVNAKTKKSIAKKLQAKCKQLSAGPPSVYKIPLQINKKSVDEKIRFRKCEFGQKMAYFCEKTIMLIGATGSGKSTLIDGMINYLSQVTWDDGFRFSLIDLAEDEKNISKAESQTQWVTCYTLYHEANSIVNFNLNIIDTPGFGDTAGLLKDKAVTEQIKQYFEKRGDNGVPSLDAVCFVTPATGEKLTATQRYIFDAILSIFGKDIKDNICILITFADGNIPPVLTALEAAKVPYNKTFKFNNSALYVSPQNNNERKITQMFWGMGMESFKTFFEYLQKTTPRTLDMTIDVLGIRQKLEAIIEGLQSQITEGLNHLNTIRQEREILKRHKDDIAARRNFSEFVDVFKMKKIELETGFYVTNCRICNKTCHRKCSRINDEDKIKCMVMDELGNCTVCPQKCIWSNHQNNTFRFETYVVREERTFDDLKRKFEIAGSEALKSETMIAKVKQSFKVLGEKVTAMLQDARKYVNELEEKALRKNPLSNVEYIDLLIKSEELDKKYGWQERIHLYMKIRRHAELLEKSTDTNFNPWNDDDIDV